MMKTARSNIRQILRFCLFHSPLVICKTVPHYTHKHAKFVLLPPSLRVPSPESMKAAANSPAVEEVRVWHQQAGIRGLLADGGAVNSNIMGRWSEIAVLDISLKETESPWEIKSKVCPRWCVGLSTDWVRSNESKTLLVFRGAFHSLDATAQKAWSSLGPPCGGPLIASDLMSWDCG